MVFAVALRLSISLNVFDGFLLGVGSRGVPHQGGDHAGSGTRPRSIPGSFQDLAGGVHDPAPSHRRLRLGKLLAITDLLGLHLLEHLVGVLRLVLVDRADHDSTG